MAITLSGDRDPLGVQLFHDDVGDDMFSVVDCLRGSYADLTTWDVLSAAQSGRTQTRSSRSGATGREASSTRHRSRATMSGPRQGRLPSGTRSNKNAWPSHLAPLGDTALHLAAFVAGHRLLLAPGWTPSREAIERAALVGIKLGTNETWVRPHVRGAPHDFELRFAWKRHHALAARTPEGFSSGRVAN